jgi:very-short-patch-repair endonuclease
VLKAVSRSFDPVLGEFRFFDRERPIELFAAAFAADSLASLDVKKWRASLEFQDLHPLDNQPLSHYLKGLAGSIENGEFSESGEREVRVGGSPRIILQPVLFIRKRETGLAEFIDEILVSIPDAENFPTALEAIVGSRPAETSNEIDASDHGSYANEQLDVLLTKPANGEQLEILRRLKRKSDVLVQGPPGTGKTHTIANLIGSLLSDGKSVLVTSHSTKALRVLREKVSEPLQNLCVSVLDNDKESRGQREAAIRELSSKLSDDADDYKKRATDLRARRSSLIEAITKSRKGLLEAVQGEYLPIILQGEQTTPADAARFLAETADMHSWLPGPIDATSALPLTLEEVQFLYQSNHLISAADELELDEALPSVGKLPPVASFEALVEVVESLQRHPHFNHRPELWSEDEQGSDELESFRLKLVDEVRRMTEWTNDHWKLVVIDAGVTGEPKTNIWRLLTSQIREVTAASSLCAEALFKFRPKLHNLGPISSQLSLLLKIEQHLKSGGGLSAITVLVKGWAKHLERWQVREKNPNSLDDIIALRSLAELEILREELRTSWEHMMTRHGLPSLRDKSAPEDYAGQYTGTIEDLLSWHDHSWSPILDTLKREGLTWERLLSEAPPFDQEEHRTLRLQYVVQELLPNVVLSESLRRRFRQAVLDLSKAEEMLKNFQSQRRHPSPVLARLIGAVSARSTLEYRGAYDQLFALSALSDSYLRRKQLISAIAALAPSWAASISSRTSGSPDKSDTFDPKMAWRALQFAQEIDRRSEMDVADLLTRLQVSLKELEGLTAALVEQLAWAELLPKVSSEQRQALLGWAATMKKIGSGTGKLVPELRKQAKREMEKARGAVPVWIMPFSSVTSSFHPVRDRFDVLIIDEASQEDILGLATFYMADKVIVVGDDEQVTPLDVGGQQASVQHLISQWLGELPSPLLFDTKTSIYDRAQISFGSVIRLREHFRCVPEIIQFSNALCYNFSIRPLRESASTNIKPALVSHRVLGNNSRKTNQEEADEIVRLIAACTRMPEYSDKTFGVISMVGDDQTRLIDNQLRLILDPAVYQDRRLLCGSPAQFQGDERDVIFLSLVDSKEDEAGPLTMRQDGADGMWKKRFNVAASRARDQLWVVHSVDPDTQLKAGDIRRRLIEHARDPSALMTRLSIGLDRTESHFEAEVLKLIVAKGFEVKPQWEVGAYRIDMVVEGNGKRLAIECDGDRWHYDKAEEDLARQALLERLGWRFVRLRGSTFYRDARNNFENAMAPVFKALKSLGIEPTTQETQVSKPGNNHALLEEVKRVATAIKLDGGGYTQVQTAIPKATKPSLTTEAEGEPTQLHSDKKPQSVNRDLFTVDLSDTSPSTSDLKGSSFTKGQRVEHSKFGTGVVEAISGSGSDLSLMIRFPYPWGQKTIYPAIAKLRLLD